MCGRFYLDTPPQQLADYFDLPVLPELAPRYNIAPGQQILAVRNGERGREWISLRWGLIPFWAKDEKIGYRTINARAETVDIKPAFRAAFRYRRCLIPASGFFEWQANAGRKQPYCIHPTHQPVLAFAGLYEHWQGEAGETIDSCTILVTGANVTIAPVHDRMPLILGSDDFCSWLDPMRQTTASIKPLLKPLSDVDLGLHPVSLHVNNPRNDDRSCIASL